MALRCDTEKLAEIAQREHMAFVVLFGSMAKGQAGPQSDVDVGVCLICVIADGPFKPEHDRH